MTSAEVVLRAYALAQASLEAESDDAAVEEARADLEVLSREELVRVAAAQAVMVPRRMVPEYARSDMRRRLQRERLEIGWAQS